MKIGYARVSTEDQIHDLQIKALRDAGCDKIYSDTISGKTTSREGLDKALAAVGEGDTLVVWKLDRLGRKTLHVLQLVEELEDRGVGFRSLQEEFDTGTTAGKLMFQMLGMLAEFERNTIVDRVTAGMEAAKERGVHCGRPPMDQDMINQLVAMRASGMTCSEAGDLTGVPKSTVGYVTKGLL